MAKPDSCRMTHASCYDCRDTECGCFHEVDCDCGHGASPTLYDDLKAAGCRIEGYESDLYVRATPTALKIIEQSRWTYSPFYSKEDRTCWYEVPFAYQPFWDEKLRLAEQRSIARDQAESNRINKGGSL